MAQPLIINVQESSCREIKETLRYKPNTVAAVLTALAKDPRAGEGVLLDKDDVTISLSQDMLLAHDGPFQYLLKQGFVRKLTAQERVNALVKRFGPELRQRLEALPKKAAKRSGPITGVPTGRDPTRTSVPLIGQHFPLHGFEAPVKQAFQLFCDMDYRHVHICDYDKPQLHPNILKFVAAPGMGKTTALGALGPELYNYMWKHKDVVTEVLETRGSLLHERVFSSLQPSQPLVFTLDLKGDLDTLVREEQDLSSQEILALRMLLSTLRDNATAAQYRDLLEAVGQLMPKGDLQPLDVLLFVQAAMGLEGQHSMAIFAWDEVNAVKPSRDSETSWVQEALSAFVKLCVAAGQDRVTMMPVAIIASTLASATSLRQTASGQSIVCEVQLLPLSYRDMKSILVNVCRRAGQAWRDNDDDLDASVKQLLKFTYGIPRFLAWAIHSMSAGPGDLNDEKLGLVAKDQETCPWLLKLEVPLHAIMTRLVETARLRSGFSSWLENDGKAQVMAQILAHSVLERRVARTAYITPTITWQQAENSGMCSLLHTGTSIPTSSPTVSPTVSPNSSSGGGIGQASGSNQRQHSHLEELLTGVVRQRARADDASSKYVVFVSPLLVVAAMQGLGVDGEQLSVVPMVKHMVDFWRIREYSDLTTFILRLELARKVLGLQQMPLRHLLPREAQLPEGFQDLVIKVPEARAGKLYDRPKRRLTKDTKAEQCRRHINSSSGSSYAYIGGGSDPAPDSWLVLQTVGGKPLIIFVQSKKRQSGAGEVEPEGLDAEAEKCWGRRMKLKRLLVYVTDEPTNKVPKVYPSKAGLSVVVIGRAQHGSFYSHSVSLTKRCIEWDMENEKAKRAK